MPFRQRVARHFGDTVSKDFDFQAPTGEDMIPDFRHGDVFFDLRHGAILSNKENREDMKAP